jgi:hypothetical protein
MCHLHQDAPLETATNRSEPMDCGPNVDQTPNGSAVGGHGSGATRLWGEDRAARSEAVGRPAGAALVAVGPDLLASFGVD